MVLLDLEGADCGTAFAFAGEEREDVFGVFGGDAAAGGLTDLRLLLCTQKENMITIRVSVFPLLWQFYFGISPQRHLLLFARTNQVG